MALSDDIFSKQLKKVKLSSSARKENKDRIAVYEEPKLIKRTLGDAINKDSEINIYSDSPVRTYNQNDQGVNSSSVADSKQSGSSSVADSKKIESKINSLTGIQKDIFWFVVRNIQPNSLVTNPICNDELMTETKATKGSLKNAIIRLYKKNLISKSEYKTGLGGYRLFELSKDVFLASKNSNKKNNHDSIDKFNPLYNSNTTNTINKDSNDTKEQKPTNPQNDQLIDFIKKQNDQFQQQIAELQKQFLQQAPQVQPETKNVTVTDSAETNTPESDNDNWADLDFSSLTEFGFTQRHISQIKNFNKILDIDNKLTVDSVQESIEHYAWALQNRLEEMASYAPANNRLRGLIGVLKKGGNWTEANYKSPEDLAFEASLKAKEARLLQLKEQKERVFNIEFELWREALTATELTDIEEKGELQGKMPPSAFKNKGDNKMYVAALKTYFKNNVYKG